MITKAELKRRVQIAKYPRRGMAVVHEAPDHNPLVLEDCPACRGSGRHCIEDGKQASLGVCRSCAGEGITGHLVPYFSNDAPVLSVGLGLDDWVTCPCCHFRFSPRDKDAWSGLRHFRCGQRLVIDAMDLHIAKGLRETFAYWDDGLLNQSEIEERLFDLATETDIDKVLARLPNPWHERVFASLQHWAERPDEEPLYIFGGIYSYEMEPDLIKAAEIRGKVEEQKATDIRQFKEVKIPAILAWWARRNA